MLHLKYPKIPTNMKKSFHKIKHKQKNDILRQYLKNLKNLPIALINTIVFYIIVAMIWNDKITYKER